MTVKVNKSSCDAHIALFNEQITEIKTHVSNIHSVIYENGLVSTISKTEAISKVTLWLCGAILVSILGLTGFLLECHFRDNSHSPSFYVQD